MTVGRFANSAGYQNILSSALNNNPQEMNDYAAQLRGQEAGQAMTSDAKAALAGLEAESILDRAKYQAKSAGLGVPSQGEQTRGAVMGGIENLAGPIAGMRGGGGGIGNITSDTGSFTTGNPSNVISNPMADIQRSLGPGVKFGMY